MRELLVCPGAALCVGKQDSSLSLHVCRNTLTTLDTFSIPFYINLQVTKCYNFGLFINSLETEEGSPRTCIFLFVHVNPSLCASFSGPPSLGKSHIDALGEARCWLSLLDGSELWFTSLSSPFGGLRLFLGQDRGHVLQERTSAASLLARWEQGIKGLLIYGWKVSGLLIRHRLEVRLVSGAAD